MKKTLVKSLKKLLKALGGEDSEQKTVIGVVDEITEQIEEGGSSSNNNSGNSEFLITGTPNQDMTQLSIDKNIDEIYEAYSQGKILVLKIENFYDKVYPVNTSIGTINGSSSTVHNLVIPTYICNIFGLQIIHFSYNYYDGINPPSSVVDRITVAALIDNYSLSVGK